MKRDGTPWVGSLADPGAGCPAFLCHQTYQPRHDTLRAWLGRAGRGGSEELFLKKKTHKKSWSLGWKQSRVTRSGQGRPGLAHTLPTEGLGCFKCIVF